jgi:hypothetical protein
MKKLLYYQLEVLTLKEERRNVYEVKRKTLNFPFFVGLARSIAHRKKQTLVAYKCYDNGELELLNY